MKKEKKDTQNGSGTEKKKKGSILDLFQHTWFIITALVVAVFIVAAIVIGIVMATQNLTLGEVFGIKVKRIDYVNDPLDKYISIDESDYKDIEVDLNIRKPGDIDVLDKKTQVLASAAHKAGLDKGGQYQFNEPIEAGDKIYFYYAAYLVDENGNRIKEISGLNNCKDSKNSNPAEFIVGSGDFSFIQKSNYIGSSTLVTEYEETYIHGFESGLIGNVPKNYKFYTAGEIIENDIVYATATYVDYDGLLYDRANIRIDLSDENYESIWGEGIYEYLISENQIGFENKDPITLKRTGSGQKITFTNFTVDYIVRGEETPITIKTVFPYDYSDESLRNETVYFDIFIEKTLCYKTPEFNDDFILNTLGLTEEKLAEYDGDTLEEKCDSYYLQQLSDEYEVNRRLLAEDLLWDKLKENVEIKKMPEKEVQYEYDDYVFLCQWACEKANENGAGYESFDDYMIDMLGLELGAYWNVYVWDFMENAVLEKLIFYSIIRGEGLIDDTEAFEKFCEEELERSYKLETGKTSEDFETADKYAEQIAAYRVEKVNECGGDEGFIDEMYYRYASDIVFNNAKLNDVLN